MFKPTKPQHVVNKKYLDDSEAKLVAIPDEVPDSDGTYVLKCTVEDGEATYAWVAESNL